MDKLKVKNDFKHFYLRLIFQRIQVSKLNHCLFFDFHNVKIAFKIRNGLRAKIIYKVLPVKSGFRVAMFRLMLWL